MMLPPRCRAITGTTSCIKLKADFMLTSMTVSHCCSLIRITRPSRVIPALLTSTSIRPKSFTISATTACVSAKLAALAAYPFTRWPYAAISAIVPFASSLISRSVNAMSAPSDANCRATALPMPRAAPVISATFPSKRPISSRFLMIETKVNNSPNSCNCRQPSGRTEGYQRFGPFSSITTRCAGGLSTERLQIKVNLVNFVPSKMQMYGKRNP